MSQGRTAIPQDAILEELQCGGKKFLTRVSKKICFIKPLVPCLRFPKNTGVQGWKGISCPQLLPRTYCNSLKIFNKAKIFSLTFQNFWANVLAS
jgi:hypothetical protein